MLSSLFCINQSNEEGFALLFNHPVCLGQKQSIAFFTLSVQVF